MERTIIAQTPTLVGQTVLVSGWVDSVRKHGQLVFVDLRDRSGYLQLVGNKDLSKLKEEYVVSIVGVVRQRDPKYYNPKLTTGQIELEVEQINIISQATDLPFDVHQPELNVSLPVLLDYRPASLRNKKVQDIFRVQSAIVKAFRDYLNGQDFTEIFVPTIVAGSTEGGSEVFPIDYFGYQAYLAQSPQLYKQVLVTAFERVFTVAHAYRAEPSVTTRHLTEYVGLDVEMGFIQDWQEVLKTADQVVKAIFSAISRDYGSVLEEFGVTIPATVEETPSIKLKDALELIYQRTGRDVRHELDMDPEGEREICRWAKEEYGSDMVFITHFYTKKRAWYSFADPQNPQETLTFDLIGRGVEWISGGQRIHNYQELQQKIISRGQNPEDFEVPYGQAFKYGMPPEGGFCIGLERITTNILGLDNLRQASLFPRDMERIDSRLSQIGKKIKATKKEDLHQKLISYLDEHQVSYRQLEHPQTKTSAESAQLRGTKLEQGAKALVMKADDKPVLVVLSAATKLDNSLFKKQYKVKDLQLASPGQVEEISGVGVGAVPPFGNLFNLPVYIDKQLTEEVEIAFNAGSLTNSIIMKTSDFLKLVNPIVGEYAKVSQ
jgi:nondiscriminating aspartyl-tRNA synthetase